MVFGLQILLVITSLLLVLLVLLHRAKGGGLSSLFGGGVQSSLSGSTVVEKNLDRLTLFVTGIWLVAIIGYRAAWGMANLDALLRDPITQALLAASPPEARKSLGRTLRPLCRLLGVDLPQELSAPPRPEPASGTITARPAKPPKPAPPPLRHPIYPLRRPRLILYPDPPRKTRA